MTETQKQLITCDCGHEYEPRAGWQSEQVREGVTEHYLVCPMCGMHTHLHFETDALRQERDKLKQRMAVYQNQKNDRNWQRFKTAQAVFRRKFDKEQRKWRKKLNVVERAES